jgi:hypothetical protein
MAKSSVTNKKIQTDPPPTDHTGQYYATGAEQQGEKAKAFFRG